MFPDTPTPIPLSCETGSPLSASESRMKFTTSRQKLSPSTHSAAGTVRSNRDRNIRSANNTLQWSPLRSNPPRNPLSGWNISRPVGRPRPVGDER